MRNEIKNKQTFKISEHATHTLYMNGIQLSKEDMIDLIKTLRMVCSQFH